MEYFVYIATAIVIYCIANLAYAIPLGYTGLVNFGHVGLLAVGAYTAAILSLRGVPFLLALLAAAGTTALAGLLLSLPSRRIKSDYYALVTLGFIFVVNSIILNWTSLTGGPFGLSAIPRPEGFQTPEAFLFLAAVTLGCVALFVQRVVHSPFGRALEAVRDDEEVAALLGKRVFKLKITAMVLSGMIAGIGGAYLAYFIRFINNQVFWLDLVVFLIAALVIGGLASFPGTLIGVILLFALQEPMRFLPISGAYLGPLRIMLWSFLLLLFVIFRPRGIMGRAELD